MGLLETYVLAVFGFVWNTTRAFVTARRDSVDFFVPSFNVRCSFRRADPEDVIGASSPQINRYPVVWGSLSARVSARQDSSGCHTSGVSLYPATGASFISFL